MTVDRIEAAAVALETRAHGTVKRDAPIGPLTSYRIGGPAAVFVEAANLGDLAALGAALRASDLPLLIIGRGSNVLVSDEGFPGIVVRLGTGFRWSEVEGVTVRAGAAMPLPALAALTSDHSLTGFEFGAAIPASLGGAVRMNAGAHGSEMRDVLISAEVYLLEQDATATIATADAGFAYRTSAFPDRSVVVAAALSLRAGERDAIDREIRAVRDWRRAHQPLSLPNGGSVFKNPPGEAAGRLVEMVCGKGTRVGGARISEVHANFIVTEEGARADDVYTLIRLVQRRVRDETGIQLEPELKLIGSFQEGADGRNA